MTVSPDFQRSEPVRGQAAEVLRDATLPYSSSAYPLYEADWAVLGAEPFYRLPAWWHTTVGALLGYALPQASSIMQCSSGGSATALAACWTAEGPGRYVTLTLFVFCLAFWLARRPRRRTRSRHEALRHQVEAFFEKERKRRRAFNE